jgi:hypothetical protein
LSINLIVDIVGWIGAALILIAYFFVSTRRVEGNALSYQILNIFGSVFLIVNTFYYRAFPSTFVNIIWIAIAFYSLSGVYRMRKAQKQ